MRLSTLLTLAVIFAVGWLWGDEVVGVVFRFYEHLALALQDKMADL